MSTHTRFLRSLFPMIVLWLFAGVAVAGTFVEKNVKISAVRGSGFGPESKAEKYAGIKLDTEVALAPVCAWDVIAFDPSSDAGKKTLRELTALAASKTTLKSISYTKDVEGDCYLDTYEK